MKAYNNYTVPPQQSCCHLILIVLRKLPVPSESTCARQDVLQYQRHGVDVLLHALRHFCNGISSNSATRPQLIRNTQAKYPDIGLPVDGRGGYLWNSNITFSVYPSSAYPQGGHYNITWANLDEIFNKNEQVNATAGICFGFCMVTFLNILALTPKSKRGLPLYIFNLLALATLAARYLNIMVTYTALEFGSAYYQIAGGYGDGETTQSVIGIGLTIWLPPFALIFVVVCLYLQGKCVLVLIALKRRYLYVAIITYLIGLSIFTIILRLVYAIFLTASFFNSNIFVPNWMRTTVLSTYTATILSWSLIFSWQVGIYIFNRCKIGASLDRREAMSILFMTGIESMLIPSESSLHPSLNLI